MTEKVPQEIIDRTSNALVVKRNPDGTHTTVGTTNVGQEGIQNLDKVYGYTNDQGKMSFTKDIAKIPTSISIDKSSGKVVVKAPKIFTDSQQYKESILPTLQTISQNYKLNPDYKYALMKDDETTKTSEEWLNDINKELPEMVKQRVALEGVKQEVKATDGVDLSDEQVIKMSAVALERTVDGKVQLVKDDTIQSLPERIKQLRAFQNLANYSQDNHNVNYKDLMESWNREKTSDEDLIQVFNEVDKYFQEKDFSNADEYAEMVAFREFIGAKDPTAGFWRGVGDTISNVAYGVLTGAAKFDVNVMNVLEGARNLAGRAGTSLAKGEWVDEPITGEANYVKDYLEPELENLIKQHQTNTMKLNDAAGTLYGVSNTLTPLLMQIAVGNALGKAAVSGISGAASKLIAGTGEAHLVGAAEGMTAQQVATAALNGTNFLLRVSSAQVANGMVAGAIDTLRAYSGVANAVMNVADLGSQIIVDCAISDAKLYRQFLEGDVDEDTKAYLIEQAVQNLKGWAIGAGAGKLLKVAGETDTAKVINASLTPKISRAKAKLGYYADTIKVNLFHGGNANWNADKAEALGNIIEHTNVEGGKRIRLENKMGAAMRRQQNLMQRRTERLGNTLIGEMKGPFSGASNWRDVVENANEINRNVQKISANSQLLANMIYNRDTSAEISRIMLDNPTLYGAQNDYIDSLQNALKLEKKYGISASGKVMELGDGRVLASLSKESNEYVLAKYRLQVANDAMVEYKKISKNIKPVQEEAEYYAKYIEDFEQNHDPELVTALNDLELKAISYSGATQDARVATGVMDQEDLDEMRESGYFTQGYMRTQRASDWEAYQKRGGELHIGKLRDDQHLVWGLGEDGKPREFQDVTFVLFDDVNQLAKQSMRKTMMGYLENLGVKTTVVISGDEVKAAKTVNGIGKEKVFNTLNRDADKFVRDMTQGDWFDKFYDREVGKSKILTQEDKLMKLGAAEVHAAVAPVEASNRLISKTLRNAGVIDDDVAIAAMEDALGMRFVDIPEDDFEIIINSMPESAKKIIRQHIRSGYATPTVVGEITPSQLPIIKTSEWEAATGLKYKDAGPMKRFLSEKRGTTIDQALDNLRADRGMTVYDESEAAWNVLSDIYDTVLDRTPIKGGQISYETFQELYKKNPRVAYELEAALSRELVAKNYLEVWDNNDGLVRKIAEDNIRQQNVFDAKTLYAKNSKKLEEIKTEVDLPGMETNLNERADRAIDDLIATSKKDANTIKSFNAVASIEDTDNADDIVEYAVLKNLARKKNLDTFSDNVHRVAKKEYANMMRSQKVMKDGKKVAKWTPGEIERFSNQYAAETAEWFRDRVLQRYGNITETMKATNPDLVDYKDIYGRVDEINKEIAGVRKSANIVKTYDDNGMEEYVELSPTVANLVTTMPTPLRRGTFAEIEQNFSRIFRMGTTGGLNPASLIRQGFRDLGNAVVMGNMTRSGAEVERILVESFGDTVATYYRDNVPDVWQTLLRQSDETGESIQKLAVERELSRSEAAVGTQLEQNLYDFTRQNRIARNKDGIYDKAVFDNMKTKLEKFYDKTETLNNIREKGLRVGVYKNAYLQALQNGHSVQDARRFAEMLQAEATTNFGRQSYHLANLTKTVPYLGSAINGSKSFWRLYALDPAGVTFRIAAGYVTPMFALLNQSMATKENLEVYKQIPEYEKADNLVFVLNGQKLSIPIPQEISSFISPLRSTIEMMHNANDHSFGEVLANDMVGFSPLDLEGFINIDADRILVDNGWENVVENHLRPGFSKLASSMMTPLVKSGVMMATGYDPYTGKKIDTSYVTIDPETGESLVMDYKSGALAKLLGNIFGDFVSAPMAQAVLNNLLGSNNMNIIDGLSEIAVAIPSEEGILGGLSKAPERIVESAANVLYTPDYGEQSNSAWKRAVSQLYAEKEALLTSKEYQKDLQTLSQGGITEAAENAIRSRIASKREAFQEKVLQASKNLVKEYNGTFDRYKFGSVLSLMTFNDGYNQTPGVALSDKIYKQEFQLARAQALETMQSMGFNSPNDTSMFGYYGMDKETGETNIEFYSPLAILNFSKSTQLADDVALANISAVVNEEGLWDQHTAMRKQIDAIYDSKKKLSKSDYAKIEATQINWNAQVAKAIAPYLSKMTAEAALNNTQVLNYLKPLIEVPSSWEVNDKGRYVSLGSRGSKKDAYYQSWIKTMFSVNDKYKGQY